MAGDPWVHLPLVTDDEEEDDELLLDVDDLLLGEKGVFAKDEEDAGFLSSSSHWKNLHCLYGI